MTVFAFEIYTLLPIGVFETHEIFEPITQGGSRDQAPNTRIKFWQVCVVAFAKLHVLLNLPQRHLKWRGGGRGEGGCENVLGVKVQWGAYLSFAFL